MAAQLWLYRYALLNSSLCMSYVEGTTLKLKDVAGVYNIFAMVTSLGMCIENQTAAKYNKGSI